MDFRIRGLSPEPFAHLFGRSDAELHDLGAVRRVCDASPGFPDRVEIRDLRPGEVALLVNHVHHDVPGPYRASHAVFVREGATVAYDRVNEVPDVLRIRPISLRAFDARGYMQGAELIDGPLLEAAIERLLADPEVTHLHAHYAVRGCFAATVERA